ncbi:hypothetical protein K7432_006056 [Basidiobolus ranarum]|uniref:Uncharacterized protein n=1 Tax=Basidiobolus ranarum TaxID=34480 RepID=A0ABR2WVP9_9FUNG
MGKDSSITTNMQDFPNLKSAKPPTNLTPSKIRNLLEDQSPVRVSSNLPGRLPKNGPIILRPGDDGLFSPSPRKFPHGGYTKSELGFSSPKKTKSDDGFGSDSSDSSNRASILSSKTDLSRRIRPLSMSRYSSIPHRGQTEDLEAKEARTNRKIMDLEISNNSLLSINASLEATIKKQTTHIEQLEKKISSGGSLSPSLHDVPLVNWEDITLSPTIEDDESLDPVNDQGFTRVCSIIDTLITDAKKSLEYKKQVNGGKVLTTIQTEESLNEVYNVSDEPYDIVSRSLSDIGEEEEHELYDSIEDSTFESLIKNEEIGCQTEPADLIDSSTQTDVDEQRITELISQIWDLTDRKTLISSRVNGISLQKGLNLALPSSNTNHNEIIFSVLSQLKESLGCEEGYKKSRTSLSRSNSGGSQSSSLSGKTPTMRPRSSISRPSTPQSSRTNSESSRNPKNNFRQN